MRPRIKRLVIKASALSVIVNGVLLFAKFRERGALTSHDYLIAAASLATTFALIGLMALVFLRFGKHSDNEKAP